MADKTIALKIAIEGNKELQQLQANFTNTQRELKSLQAAEKKGIITAKEANAARASLNVQLKANRNALVDQQNAILKNNDALKKNSGFVAGVKKGVSQWATSMIGITAAIAGVTRLVGSAVKIFVDFEKANSKLAAVTRASASDMEKMKDQAKELGASTAFTASQVTDLQTEFAKLGFPTRDILNMTEATLNGAAALGSELGEQAALTGALLKQFGLDSSQAARVNDVLAESAASSALDFQKLSTALPIVGATANAVGKNLEQTTALLGTLSDRGLDASTAGTSLRNVFLELSNKGLTMDEAMAKINNSTDKAKTSMELFGKRGATTGLILAETSESVGNLEEKLDNANGAARLMAQTMLDNVAGDVTKAQSAWEGFVLSLEDGSGVLSQTSREIVQIGSSYLQMLAALNNNDTAEFGTIFLNQIGVLNDEVVKLETATGSLVISQQDLLRAAENNESVFTELNRQFQNGEIDAKKYQFGIEQLAGGWKRLTAEQKANIEEEKRRAAQKADIEEQESLAIEPELSDKEKRAIEKKAKEKAKFLKDLEAQETKDIAEEGDIIDFDTELEILQEQNEARLFVDQDFLTRQKEQRAAIMDEELARMEKEAADVKRLEEAKQQARIASTEIVANGLSVISGLMKEGSQEQRLFASAAALVQTYLAAQSAYTSQLAILTPDAPIRAAAAAAIAVASGLTNVAKINGVKFEDGGLLKGNSHANGGIPFTVGGQAGFEAEGGEAIINKRSTAMFAPLLSEINAAGGGVRFFANGGLTPSSTGVTAVQQSLNGGVDMSEFAETIVNGFNSVEVVNVATKTSDVANEVVNIQQQATF